MSEFETKVDKARAIRAIFEPLLHRQLERFETAQLLLDDGNWSDWNDLPIRLGFEHDLSVSVAWSRFETLFLTTGSELPFPTDGTQVRWLENAVPCLRPVVGETLLSVHLGCGSLTIGDHHSEIWTRLLLEFKTGWMDLYNGLDVNAFSLHDDAPQGKREQLL